MRENPLPEGWSLPSMMRFVYIVVGLQEPNRADEDFIQMRKKKQMQDLKKETALSLKCGDSKVSLWREKKK